MRIAQVAPLYESVPPKLYGGTERVVSFLTEELVRAGHEVTLFASADSKTSAKLVPSSSQSLRTSTTKDQMALHVHMIEQVYRQCADFDLIHFHTDYLHFPVTRREHSQTLTTLHGRLDLPELQLLHREFKEIPLVSISNAQREPLPFSNWVATVYHGLPLDLYPLNPHPEGYVAFLGRISPEKRVDRAIEIARKAGYPLKIAAKVDRCDLAYFESTVRPLLAGPGVEFIGEISDSQKAEFLGKATALLFPIDWPEPFGLVMIEALACGTPVIAFEQGSVREILSDGRTGFIVQSIEQAVKAMERISEISRLECRADFETRFSVERMANDYLRIYRQTLEQKERQLHRVRELAQVRRLGGELNDF